MSQVENNRKFELLITGVGGQGAILASDIIGKSAVAAGLPIRAAETHGMAQRGGSVVNHIRIGEDLGSMIPKKGADLMLALEPMETVRYSTSPTGSENHLSPLRFQTFNRKVF